MYDEYKIVYNELLKTWDLFHGNLFYDRYDDESTAKNWKTALEKRREIEEYVGEHIMYIIEDVSMKYKIPTEEVESVILHLAIGGF